MPTLNVCTGFEHGLTNLTSLFKGNVGNRFADGVNGSPAIVTSTPRSGTYCLECSSTAATEGIQWNTNTFGASKPSLVVGFGLYIPTALPAADVTLTAVITTGSVDLELAFRNSDDRLVLTDHNGGNLVAGPVIAADTWYWIDIHLDVSAATYTADWQVDGAAQTQWSAGGGAAGSVTDLWLGWRFDAQTMTARYDDLVLSTTGADYPLGEHKLVLLTPDTGGSTAQIGTGNATGRMVTNSAIDATHNSANILAATSEIPPLIGASATGVGQRTSGSGNAVGIPMTTYTLDTGETVSGLRVEVVGWAGSTTANNLGLRTFNGSVERILFTVADPNFDNNTTSPAWLCKMATAADVDTQAELDALVVRLGYSTDISPLPGAHAIYAELAVKEAAGAGGTDLEVDDAGHAHTADEVALTQVHALAVADTAHGHTADQVALTQVHTLVIHDAVHGHTADQVDLEAGAIQLVVADATHGHSADLVTLTQQHALVVADALHGHAADSPALVQQHVLAVQDALHAHAADVMALVQVHGLVVADALHGHASDNVTLDSAATLAIHEALHGHTADGLTLTQVHALGVDEALHGHTADGLVLVQVHLLAVDDALHAHTADVVVLVTLGEPTVSGSPNLRRHSSRAVLRGRPQPSTRSGAEVSLH